MTQMRTFICAHLDVLGVTMAAVDSRFTAVAIIVQAHIRLLDREGRGNTRVHNE